MTVITEVSYFRIAAVINIVISVINRALVYCSNYCFGQNTNKLWAHNYWHGYSNYDINLLVWLLYYNMDWRQEIQCIRKVIRWVFHCRYVIFYFIFLFHMASSNQHCLGIFLIVYLGIFSIFSFVNGSSIIVRTKSSYFGVLLMR